MDTRFTPFDNPRHMRNIATHPLIRLGASNHGF